MNHQQQQELYNADWNAGFEAFVNGVGGSFDSGHYSPAWNEGYQAAREIVAAAERDCISDYDDRHYEAAKRAARVADEYGQDPHA